MTNGADNGTRGPLLYSMKTAAEELGLSVWQVKKLIDHGELTTVPVNGRKYVPAREVHNFANGTTPKDVA